MPRTFPTAPADPAGVLPPPPSATKSRDNPNLALAAGLRAPTNRPSQGAPTPGTTTPFKPFRTDPLNVSRALFLTPPPNQYIACMRPLISANPRDAPHCTRGASAAGKESLPQMNADER
jgi:hypothetical protein